MESYLPDYCDLDVELAVTDAGISPSDRVLSQYVHETGPEIETLLITGKKQLHNYSKIEPDTGHLKKKESKIVYYRKNKGG